MKEGRIMSNLINPPRILILATTASMIEQFNMHNIMILKSLGVKVHVGTNFEEPGNITQKKSSEFRQKLEKMDVTCHQVDFLRGVGNHKQNKKALVEVISVIKENKISGIHAHSPLGGIIGRRAAHKTNTKIIYTTHGFQFFKHGRIRDWLLFFPVELFYSKWTDAIITINKQDYDCAKHMFAKRQYYIPGVGTDILDSLSTSDESKESLRKEVRAKLGIADDEYLIISVGELNNNKNHETVIKAISKLNNPKIKYVIAGIGKKRKQLTSLIQQLGLSSQIKLLGYQDDLNGLYYAADLNAFISKREGLGLGGLDGVARGVYIIGTMNTGMADYIVNNDIGILIDDPVNVQEVSDAINISMHRKHNKKSLEFLKKFDYSFVDKTMQDIYRKEFLGQ